MSTFSSLSTLDKLVAVVVAMVIVGTVLYFAWPLIFLFAGAGQLCESGQYMVTDHRMKYEQDRGVVFTNTDDRWSRIN